MYAGAGALFGNSSGRSQNKNLVEFKAGKMTLKGKMVYPDKRKGLVYVYQSEDALIHFCWKDRLTNMVEDDLIIFPDECEFKHVPQCTTGRVYVLKFKSSTRRLFFWVQEPKTDKDDENCQRINELMNNPPAPEYGRSDGGPLGTDGDIQSLLNNMTQQQLMQLFGGIGQIEGLSSILDLRRQSRWQTSRTYSESSTSITTAAAETTATTATTSDGSAAAATGPNTTTATSAEASASEPANPAVDLSTALTAENLQAILSHTNAVNELLRYLPPVGIAGSAPAPEEQLQSTLSSSQFQQALSMFSAALQTGQLGPTMKQFEVSAEAVNAANQGNMEKFIKALQKGSNKQDNEEGTEKKRKNKEEKKKKGEEKKKKEKDNDDEGMSMN